MGPAFCGDTLYCMMGRLTLPEQQPWAGDFGTLIFVVRIYLCDSNAEQLEP